jgi:hypothetical protein
MPSLLSLPDELLLEIIKYLDQDHSHADALVDPCTPVVAPLRLLQAYNKRVHRQVLPTPSWAIFPPPYFASPL